MPGEREHTMCVLRQFPLRRKLLGYRNYYGVIGNSRMLSAYYYYVIRMLYKWLNRRSQRRSMTWAQFQRRLPGW